MQPLSTPGASYDRDQTLGALFTQVATEHAARVAIIGEHGSLTYADVLAQAQAAAAAMQQQGVCPGDTVGLLGRRAPGTIAHLLGALFIGAAYMPMDPAAMPGTLLAAQAHVGGVRLLVCDGTEPPAELRHLPVLREQAAAVTSLVPPQFSAAQTAYILFTSGSTGTPKGVAVPHRAIARLVCGQSYASFGADERVLLHSPLSFDASTFEIWSALLHGGTLVLAPDRALALEDYGALIEQHRLTTLWLTAAVFHLVARHAPGSFATLEQLLVGGDVVSPAAVALVQAACPGLRIINGYGPTESTTFALTYTLPASWPADRAVPIGRPIAHTTAYIIDDALEPVPDGSEGQLALGGDGIALGYVGQPAATAGCFREDPFSPHAEARLYLTGDRVLRDADGLIHFRGRMDQEAKIAGHRVHLQEVEALICAHPSVQHAAIFVRGVSAEEKQIAGIVAPSPGGGTLSEVELRAWLAARLPGYAVPAAIRIVDALPLNAHGKLDRASALALLATEEPKLPASPPDTPAKMPAEVTPPLTAVLAAWKTLLESDDIAPDTNFFDAGGDSLLLIQLHWQLNKLDRGTVDLIDLFSETTPRKMAALLDQPVAAAR